MHAGHACCDDAGRVGASASATSGVAHRRNAHSGRGFGVLPGRGLYGSVRKAGGGGQRWQMRLPEAFERGYCGGDEIMQRGEAI